MQRLFTPFFTTKNKGIGLGLAVCHEIVLLHKGRITIDSKINKGTNVNIILPIKEVL